MLKNQIKDLYEHEFSKHEYDRYYSGIRYLGNRYLLSKLSEMNLKGKKILDLGSGRLTLSSFLSKFGSSVVAFDIPEVFNDKFLKARACRYGINLVGSIIQPGRSFNLPFKNRSFEFVLMTEVLEHLNFSPIFLLYEMYRVLNDNGYLILTTPNVHRFENKVKFMLNKTIYGNFERYLNEIPFHNHWREFEKNELFNILTQCGFKVTGSFYCNDILINKYSSYLYKEFSKKIMAYLKKIFYALTILVPSLKKQLIILAAKN